jgi:hypothetical protein
MTTTLVTGATRGIGREAARPLVQAGQEVYLGAREPRAGAEVAALIGATPVQLDATTADSIASAVDRICGEVVWLDVSVNNAGIAGEQRRPGDARRPARGVRDERVRGCNCDRRVDAPARDKRKASRRERVQRRRIAEPEHGARLPVDDARLPDVESRPQYADHPICATLSRWRVNSATPGLTATEFTGSPRGRTDR